MKKLLVAVLACFAITQVHAAHATWLTSLSQAQAQAKAENKLILMNFTGSDWCPWCIKLDKDTLDQQQFVDYANKNLVLVTVDFPQNKEQPADLKAANAALAKKYDVSGFPTLVVAKPDGTAVWTQVGYLEGGPEALISQLETKSK